MSYTLKMKEIRKQRKLTQAQLAELIGETDRVIGAWERGETALPLESAYKIALALECTLNDLCGWYETHPREEGGEHLSSEEREIVGCYRDSTPQWKQNISMTARAAAGESKEAAERAVSVAAEQKAV